MTAIEAKEELDTPFIIREAFLGYKYRKREGQLYEKDGIIPTKLIKLYYSLKPSDADFDKLKKSFITRYVKNESLIEGVNEDNLHSKSELSGLSDMYEYLHSSELDEDFCIYSLKELNRKLFSHNPFPEYAGIFRNHPVYLPGTGLDLCDYSMINIEIYKLSNYVIELHQKGKRIRQSNNTDELVKYIDECIMLKCKLIWIHPFPDGNGRTIRAFINKLLEDAGLPPIYIKFKERAEYEKAMNSAIGDGNYTAIKAFYKYKICDSIIELDINKRLKEEKAEIKVKKRKQINKI